MKYKIYYTFVIHMTLSLVSIWGWFGKFHIHRISKMITYKNDISVVSTIFSSFIEDFHNDIEFI